MNDINDHGLCVGEGHNAAFVLDNKGPASRELAEQVWRVGRADGKKPIERLWSLVCDERARWEVLNDAHTALSDAQRQNSILLDYLRECLPHIPEDAPAKSEPGEKQYTLKFSIEETIKFYSTAP